MGPFSKPWSELTIADNFIFCKVMENERICRGVLETLLGISVEHIDYLKTENPIEKALIAVLMIAYIQPFEDGNKRTSRILGNALLLASDYCPLSYRSVDEVEYKKAIIMFYEQNNATYFKKLFLEQYRQAVKKYF